MPRKPGIGPAILAIERLSDGIDPTAVDDFTGESLAQPHAKPVHGDPKALAAQRSKAQLDSALRVLIASGMVTADSALPKPKPPLMLGPDHAVVVKPKPLRRL